MNFDKPFTLDKVVRLLLIVAFALGVYFLLDRLSAVLLPFFLAWLTAYLMEPVVAWIERWVKYRGIAVVISMLLILGFVTGLLVLTIPLIIEEIAALQSLISSQLSSLEWPAWIPKDMVRQVEEFLMGLNFKDILSSEGVADKALNALNRVWGVFTSFIGALSAIFGMVTYLLYLAFIMLDFKFISYGWKRLVPENYTDQIMMLAEDLENGMNGYFKAQTKIVFVVSILFVIGFKIIGLPFAIVMGIVLGIMNYIPYSQLIGIFPAVALGAMHSFQTGGNFWIMLLLILVVFSVVQLIQDIYLTPKFMGDFSGFNPAIILLSLSVWGSLLGVLGVIIAIPITSILLSYYKRYVLNKE
ncbi:MAG: AI-2E family transporter [Salibacteraceae bacterium]